MASEDLPNAQGLAPLKWFGPMEAAGMSSWIAGTPCGQYLVKHYAGRTHWSYMFYNGAHQTECGSVSDGKAAAWEHWRETIQRCFTPHPMDGERLQVPEDGTGGIGGE